MEAEGTLRGRTPLRGSRALERFEPAILTWLALGALLVIGAVFLFYETRGTTFWFDEWLWALERHGGGVDSLLRPHNGHLSLIPVAVYKLLFNTAGLDDYAPYRAAVIACHLAYVALLFVYVRRRLGGYLALLAAALILFLGPGWQDILWPFQIGWLISLAAGLGALLLLDRRDRTGDAVACVLVALSLASLGLGVAIALGVAVEVLWGRRRLGDIWIVAGPLALYGLWWIGYGDSGAFVRHNVVLVPTYVADAAAGAVGSLAGLASSTALPPEVPLGWGRPLALLAVAVLLWRLAAVRPVLPRILTLLTTVLAFWTLTALNRANISDPASSRYVYVGAVFVVLIAAELARGSSVSRRAAVVLTAGVALAIVSNVGVMRQAARYLKGQAQTARADLGAVELARSRMDPNRVLEHFPGFPLVLIQAGRYFAAERDLGTPADTPAEIAREPEGSRRVADLELIADLNVALQPTRPGIRLGRAPRIAAVTGGAVTRRGSCIAYRPAGAEPPGRPNAVGVRLPATGLLVTAQGGPVTVSVRRFGDQWRPVGRVLASTAATLRIGADASPLPWRVRLAPGDRAALCGLARTPTA